MNIQEFVKRELGSDNSGHSYLHATRVASLAKMINRKEGGDARIIEAASFLHDCMDSKLFSDIPSQKEKIISVLKTNGYSASSIKTIMDIIEHLSWHIAKREEKPFPYKEGNIVRDADRLEALGAIGILRATEYGASRKRAFYEEEDLKRAKQGLEPISNTTLAHFYEKLLLLEPYFITTEGKRLAKERTDFIRLFLKEFYKETLDQ